jgi:UDP-MurNAc hydroxylase
MYGSFKKGTCPGEFMKFTNLGGATGFLEHKGKRILFDPWLDEGIFHGAWHHYPPVNLPEGIEGLGRFDYVYISHIHEDHCSLKTLELINKDAEIIIMDRRPNFVLQFLEKNQLNFKGIHKVKPQTRYKLEDDLYVDMVTADPAHELNYVIDSGLIIEWDGFKIYNANDCPPYKEGIEYIKSNYPKLDLALIPYATGSSYPACFTNLSHEKKLKEKERLFRMGVQIFNDAAVSLEAKYVMPFADQYIIVGNKYELNEYMPHPPSAGVIRDVYDSRITSKLLLLNSNQSFDLVEEVTSPPDSFYQHTDKDREEYALEHRDSLYDFERFTLSRSVNLSSLVNIAVSRLFEILKKQNYTSDTKLIIEVLDWKQKYVIDLKNYTLKESAFNEVDEQPFLKAAVGANLLTMLITGHISWNIADAALFIDYTRLPNTYDPKVHSLWNYIKI